MYSAGVVQVLPRRQRALMMSHQKWWAIRSWQCPPERSKLILLKLHEKLSKDSTLTILLSFCIWSKLERWRSWISGCLISWLQIKKKKSLFWSVVFFYSLQQQTISQSDCDLWQKADFIRQPETTSSVVGLRSSFKARPKARLAPKKGLGHYWWSASSLIHCSFLNPGKTIISEKYAQKIEEIHQKLQCLQLG